MSKPAAFARMAATTEGLAKIRTAKTAQRTPEGKKWTYGRIANVISTAKGYISEDTVERFFRGDRVYRDNALAIAEVFGFTLEEICGQDEPTADETTPYVGWQEVCGELLAQQQWLTSNSIYQQETVQKFLPKAENNLFEFSKLDEYSSLQQSAQNDNVKIFCVDGSKFSSPENPCVDIYIELLNQDCLPASNGLPQSMNALKAYWRLDLPELCAGKRPVMVFYHSRNAVHGFDDNFLKTLSTFGSMICVVTDQPSHGIQQFSPNQPNLTTAVLKWIDRTLQES